MIKLLIVPEKEIKALRTKFNASNAVSAVIGALEDSGAKDILSLKSYSKTNGYSSQDIKHLYLTGEKSVVFKAESSDLVDFDNLEVYLTLSEINSKLYDFPDETTKKEYELKFKKNLDVFNEHNEPIVTYWDYRSNRDNNYLSMTEHRWKNQLSLIEKLRSDNKKFPQDSYEAEVKEQSLFKFFLNNHSDELPGDINSYGDLNRFMYQTAEFFDLECVRKN